MLSRKQIAEKRLKDLEENYEYCQVTVVLKDGKFAGFVWCCTDYRGKIVKLKRVDINNKLFYSVTPIGDCIGAAKCALKVRIKQLRKQGYTMSKKDLGFYTRLKK